jgi:hypothetical protein
MLFWTTLAALIALFSGAEATSPQPQTESLIRVASNTHEVRFPDEIVFRLDAEANTTITEVTIFYRLGGQKISTYGRPPFGTGNKVSTEFVLETSGSDYIPSGVDVEYHYVIKDAQGNELETEKLSLEYRDESRDWQRLSVGEFEVVWHDLERDRVEATTQEVLDQLEPVREMFVLDKIPPMKAVVVNTRGEADRTFPPVSRAARQGHLFGGFAYGNFDLFVVLGADVNDMIHEATHLMLDEALTSPTARMPTWLNEGLSMYFERDERRREQAAQALRSDDLLDLRAMDSLPGRPDEVRVFYAQAEAIVTYMVDTYGTDTMSSLVRAIALGTRAETALGSIYGLTTDQLDQQWRRSFSPTISIARRPDPGTIFSSTLVVAAAAVMFTVAAIQWRIRKRRPITDEEDDDEWDYWNNQSGT